MNDCRGHKGTAVAWLVTHRKNTNSDVQSHRAGRGNLYGFRHFTQKMPEKGNFCCFLGVRIDNCHCCDSSRAKRWYCDGVRPVMRLNEATNVERDLKPTLSLMASMV